MPRLIVPEFIKFSGEGTIIGRLLAGYTGLESALSSCVAMAQGASLDTVIKVMFRARGETQRIDVADAIGRPLYRSLGFENEFSEAVADMKFCLKIRNQFSHGHWHDDLSGRLCFVDMEEIAKPNTVITDLRGLTFKHLNVGLLNEQEAYFLYVGDCLLWLNFEGRRAAGTVTIPPQTKPKKVSRPPTCLP